MTTKQWTAGRRAKLEQQVADGYPGAPPHARVLAASLVAAFAIGVATGVGGTVASGREYYSLTGAGGSVDPSGAVPIFGARYIELLASGCEPQPAASPRILSCPRMRWSR